MVWVDEPVRLGSLVAATPMWHNADPHYVHPDVEVVGDRLADGLLARADDPPGPGASGSSCPGALLGSL
jgi:hypothetical protein